MPRRCYNGGFMLDLMLAFLAAVRVFFQTRLDTSLEILALRQQVRTQAQTIATTAELLGSPVLDSSADNLATLDRSSGHRQAGDGDCLASCWFPLVLALAITTARRS